MNESDLITENTNGCWDGEHCPRDDCDGRLQQQDQYNVMCLTCEEAWSHIKTADNHCLQTEDFETVAILPRAEGSQ
jgi:hypothetical protein